MTDAGTQFAILCCLSATGTAVGAALSAINFVDKAVHINAIVRFFAEFLSVGTAGLCLWLIILYMNNGEIRLFFAVPTTAFSMFSYICISKLLNPLIPGCKSAAKRFANSRKGKFIDRYILK